MKISKLLGATMVAGAPGRPPYPTLAPGKPDTGAATAPDVRSERAAARSR